MIGLRRLSVLCLLAAGLVAPSSALAARASLADIEDEVMCPVCGTLLELSDSPQAQRERAYINKLIAQDRSKEQIKDDLVAQYGRNVLATPRTHGFDLTAWVVPAVALLALAAGLGLVWWRRARSGPRGPRAEPPALSAEDAARLERDISSYEL
jgi:cytochrome c-type biogenesis protein CcmH